MDLPWLTDYLKRNTAVDVDASIAEFAAEEGDEAVSDVDGFLRWLKRGDKLTPEQFAAVHANSAVMTWFGDDTSHHDVPMDDPATRFRLLAPIGEGAMAVVHVARDERLLRSIAFKVAAPTVAARPSLVRRFLSEAQITAQLSHPNIVPVYDIIVQDGAPPAYAMKLVDGVTLAEVLGEDGPPRSVLLDHFLKVCDAMAYAHRKGVVHRDLKPSNIMVGPHGVVYVMDWGLAKVVGEEDELVGSVEIDSNTSGTRFGTVLGTPRYMAPEQARGEIHLVGPHTDEYALGLILYEMVAGVPARKESGQRALTMAMEGKPPSFADVQVPEGLRAIIGKACAERLHDRYGSVASLAADVRRFLVDEELEALPDSRIRATQRFLSKHRRLTLRLIIGLLLAMTVMGAAFVVLDARDRIEAQAQQQRLGAFLSEVGAVSGDVDAHFQSIEAQVQSVASAAAMLMEYADPSDGPLYEAERFLEVTPPDYAMSTAYGKRVSLEWPDVTVPGGGPLGELETSARTVYPVRHALRAAHLSMRNGDVQGWRDDPNGPTDYVMVGLANGVLVSLPGIEWKAKGFDGRVRPWYTVAMGQDGPVWGKPFHEVTSKNLLVPCSMAIRVDGRLIGIATVTVAFDHLIDRFLDLPTAREAYILSDSGAIVVRTHTDTVSRSEDPLDAGHDMGKFEHFGLVAANPRAGYAEVDGRLFAWHELHIPGWSFVVESDPL